MSIIGDDLVLLEQNYESLKNAKEVAGALVESGLHDKIDYFFKDIFNNPGIDINQYSIGFVKTHFENITQARAVAKAVFNVSLKQEYTYIESYVPKITEQIDGLVNIATLIELGIHNIALRNIPTEALDNCQVSNIEDLRSVLIHEEDKSFLNNCSFSYLLIAMSHTLPHIIKIYGDNNVGQPIIFGKNPEPFPTTNELPSLYDLFQNALNVISIYENNFAELINLDKEQFRLNLLSNEIIFRGLDEGSFNASKITDAIDNWNTASIFFNKFEDTLKQKYAPLIVNSLGKATYTIRNQAVQHLKLLNGTLKSKDTDLINNTGLLSFAYVTTLSDLQFYYTVNDGLYLKQKEYIEVLKRTHTIETANMIFYECSRLVLNSGFKMPDKGLDELLELIEVRINIARESEENPTDLIKLKQRINKTIREVRKISNTNGKKQLAKHKNSPL